MSKRDEDKFTSFLAVVIVLGVIFLIGAIGQATEEKECAKYGCNRTVSGSGSYCYVHDTYRSSSSYKSSSSSGSSSSKSTVGSSTSSSTKKNSSSSSTKKSSSSGSSWKSYDEGYDAIYEDDDYDWDRYWSDSDYADGVDDAMEDMDW